MMPQLNNTNTDEYLQRWYQLSDYPVAAKSARAYAELTGKDAPCTYAAVIRYNKDLERWVSCRNGEVVDSDRILKLTPIPEPPAEWIFGETLPDFTTQADGTQKRRVSPRGWIYGMPNGNEAIAYLISGGRPEFVSIEEADGHWMVQGEKIYVPGSDIVCWTPVPRMRERQPDMDIEL